MLLTFSLLTLALLALWASGDALAPSWRRHLWLAFLLASFGAALASEILQPLGLAWVLAAAVAAWGFSHSIPGRWSKPVFGWILFLLASALMLHALPGFSNPRVISALRFTPDAVPFTLYLNFDKAVAGILLLGWYHARMTRASEWRSMFKVAAPWTLGLLPLMLAASVVAGYVRFAPKFPAESWLWLWANLFLTCVTEEAIFRAFLQRQLQETLHSVPGGPWLALGVAAVLFGLAHASGGPAYVALATVAGLGYGWVYQRTGRIEASILTHFSLNVVHFFLFTYPALQR